MSEEKTDALAMRHALLRILNMAQKKVDFEFLNLFEDATEKAIELGWAEMSWEEYGGSRLPVWRLTKTGQEVKRIFASA